MHIKEIIQTYKDSNGNRYFKHDESIEKEIHQIMNDTFNKLNDIIESHNS